jgi:hypothetical protein
VPEGGEAKRWFKRHGTMLHALDFTDVRASDAQIVLDSAAVSCDLAHETNATNSIDIKICGLKTPEAIDRAVERGATHIGFIFFEKSPRNIEPDVAATLARARGVVEGRRRHGRCKDQ